MWKSEQKVQTLLSTLLNQLDSNGLFACIICSFAMLLLPGMRAYTCQCYCFHGLKTLFYCSACGLSMRYPRIKGALSWHHDYMWSGTGVCWHHSGEPPESFHTPESCYLQTGRCYPHPESVWTHLCYCSWIHEINSQNSRTMCKVRRD